MCFHAAAIGMSLLTTVCRDLLFECLHLLWPARRPETPTVRYLLFVCLYLLFVSVVCFVGMAGGGGRGGGGGREESNLI